MSNLSYHHFVNKVLGAGGGQDDKGVTEYLAFIASSLESRTMLLREDFPLWRAQIATGTRKDEYGEILAPCDKERMIPVPKDVGSRANPKGTAYLYLATTKRTAIHEVRPWVGEHLSLGLFNTCGDQKIIDCSKFHGRSESEYLLHISLSETQLLEKEWIFIDNAFSRPVSHNEDRSRYMPTQTIAAFIKKQGYDGIAYKSVFADGFNIALFDVSSAVLRRCSLVEVTDLQVSFNDTGESYSVGRNA